jgi:predicted Rossmann fold nucleotide-binding protein DprA/Smf involved in DNA uptake
MVESAEDVIRHLNWKEDDSLHINHRVQQISLTERERKLLELLTMHEGLRPEDLSTRSGIPIQNVLSLLTEMELKQWVHMEPGNLYQCMIVPF